MTAVFLKQQYKFLPIIIIVLLGVTVYSNSLSVPFQFDDFQFIINNNSIRDIKNLKAIWYSNDRQRFITFLTFALNYYLNQHRVFGYHVFSLVIHILSAILVWWLTRLSLSTPAMRHNKIVSQKDFIALFVGLIFVSHPIQTQAVDYIYQRSTSLVTLFYLASLSLYIKFRFSQEYGRKSKTVGYYYAASLIIAAIAMFTKQTAVTLPLAIVLYEIFFLKTKKSIDWKPLIPFILTIAVIPSGIMEIYNSANFNLIRQNLEKTAQISSWHYLLTQFKVIVKYMGLLFAPFNQNLDYDFHISRSLWETSTLASLLLLTLILIIAVVIFSRYRLVSFGIFWVFLTLLPESSIIPIKDVIFEHRLYLPMFGYCIFLVSLIYYLLGNRSLISAFVIICLVIHLYSVLTYRRNFDWQDRLVLWDDTVSKSPHKPRPYINRGFIFLERNEHHKAIVDFNKALMLYYEQLGIFEDYTKSYDEMFKAKNGYLDVYNFISVKYSQINITEAAKVLLKKVIAMDPYNVRAYSNLSAVHGDSKEFKEAITFGKKAIEIDPNFANAHYNLSVAYYFNKQYDLAFKHMTTATELGFKPEPEFLNMLESQRRNIKSIP